MTAQPKPFSESPPSFDLQPLSPEAIDQIVQVLDDWMADDSGYDEETWTELKASLNLEREQVNARRLFVE